MIDQLGVRQILRRLVLVALLSIVAIGVGHTTQHRDMPFIVEQEHKILDGVPIENNGQVLYAFYNRILFPIIFTKTAAMLPRLKQADLFVALRFVTFIACFYLIFTAIENRAAAAGQDAMALELVTVISFTVTLIHHPLPHASDIFDLTLMFFICLYLMERRLVLAFALAVLTAINRESGAFAGVVYFLFYLGRERLPRLVATSALFGIAPYALALFVRHTVYRQEIVSNSLGQWLTGIPLALSSTLTDISRLNPSSTFWMLVVMIALPTLVFLRRPSLPAGVSTRIFVACAAILVVSVQFGLVGEVRIFLPCVGLLVAAAVARYDDRKSFVHFV